MRPIPIANAADVRHIESGPYAQFMPHTHVLDALEAAAGQHAGRTALTYVSETAPALRYQHWSYAEFIASVRQAARLFRQLAGGATPRVAMLLPAMPQAYWTLWGAEAAGVVCPINYLLGEEHIAELIDAAGANIVVALGPQAELDIWSKVRGLPQRCPGLRALVAVGTPVDGAVAFDSALAQMPAQPLQAHERSAGPLAALFHTGGTTGHPKLAQHLHANQLHAAWGAACMYGASPSDVIVNGFPLFHVAGAFVYGLSMLLAGAEVVLPTLLGLRNKAVVERYWDLVEDRQATLLAAVPTVMATLMTVPHRPAQLRTVRRLLTGGATLPAELAQAFEVRFGIGVRNILGMTECGGVIAIEPSAGPRMPGAVGLPLPFSRIAIRDEAGADVPTGAEGIVWLQGPNVGPGYTDATRNAGTFAEGGWLVSGDIGRQDAEGRLYITGRAKDLIIRSSHNIDPAVIEDALLRHPDVLMAAAVGAPDEYAGEVPVAFVACKPGSRLDAQALQDFARPFIPERPAYPKQITFLDALPCTAIGKIFKPALRAQAAEAVLCQRLAALPGAVDAGAVTVQVHQAGQGLQAVFGGPGCDLLDGPIRQLMAGFALPYRIGAEAARGGRA